MTKQKGKAESQASWKSLGDFPEQLWRLVGWQQDLRTACLLAEALVRPQMDALPQPGRRKVHFPGEVCTGEDKADLLFWKGGIQWMIYTLNGDTYPFCSDPKRQPVRLIPTRLERGGHFYENHLSRRSVHRFWRWEFPLKKSVLSLATEAHGTTKTNTYSFFRA